MLRPIPISYLIGAFVSEVSRVIWDCIGVDLLHSVIGSENSRHSVNQSDARLKPFMTWSPAFRALKTVCLFLLSVLIDSWGNLPFLLIGWLPHSIEKRYTYTILTLYLSISIHFFSQKLDLPQKMWFISGFRRTAAKQWKKIRGLQHQSLILVL